MAQPALLTEHPLVDDVLSSWSEAIGADLRAYRNHVYRMFNFARALAPEHADRDELAVAAAFHDIGIWSDGTFDYLAPSARRAQAYVGERGLAVDSVALAHTIELHHKLRRCEDDAGALAEPFRQADLVDLSRGLFRFGLPTAIVAEVLHAFPNAGFHALLVRRGTAWALRHPLSPLPMMRW